MPKRTDINKVLIIGSGPIIIGQACEFDYSGTQACKALRKLGYEIVLVNSNPATIMTDPETADETYIEPLNAERLEEIIAKERPDALLPNLGGQSGLNLCEELYKKGILDKYNVKVIGVQVDSIERGEDRIEFKKTMDELGIEMARSEVAYSVEDGLKIADKLGYPVVLRPAYTMGGAGGGLVYNKEELKTVMARGLQASLVGQVLVEESILGWEELELEVVRDAEGNMITVCFIENIDPLGVHTGDSFCSAPMLTISEEVQKRLQEQAYRIVDSVKVIGGTNVQFAHDPVSDRIVVIEINPRTSRSSALASKATGYPIAKVTSKIAVGYNLDEIENAVTKKTKACFEPTIDYIVLKFPRWPFDKFVTADRTLGTQMKATGEVMAIERSFEASMLKAVRCLEIGLNHLEMPELKALSDEEIHDRIKRIDDERCFVVAEAIRRGITLEEIHDITKIDLWFLSKIQNIIKMEKALETHELTPSLLRKAKRMGFADAVIGKRVGKTEFEIRDMRKANGILPTYKMVDTCAAEFEAATPYYYSCYETEDEVEVSDRKRVVVLGSGPIRIGQGVEFDYCSVHCVWALKEMGYETIIINNNPETVSTDFDISDKLYFEPLTVEDVLNVIDKEKPEGVIVQFGGQTAINLAGPLSRVGVKILGSSVDSIDRAEDRERFDELLTSCDIPRPQGHTVFDTEGALVAAHKVGYPTMVRPSYVLGGRAMEIVYNDDELRNYMTYAVKASHEHPVLVDHYLQGTEVEVDAICDGKEVLIPGIMEHVERAGVHSGDSIAVYPPRSLSESVIRTIIEYTNKMALGLEVKGMINIQYIVRDEHVYVIEVNPRSSRTVPFLSKITGISMVDVATRCAMGMSLKEQGLQAGLRFFPDYYAVKAPVFSFNKMSNVDITLGPEMKSTGEVMACDYQYSRALYKACIASGINVPHEGAILITVADMDKPEAVAIARGFEELGYTVIATDGTAEYLQQYGVTVEVATKVSEGHPNLIDDIKSGRIGMVINTTNHGRDAERDGFKIRRSTVEHAIACLTSMDTARELLNVMSAMRRRSVVRVTALQDLTWED